MNIVLIGFMGTGKSAVGRALARRLGARLLDTDAEIERQHGKSVAQMFAQDGEDAFRAAETALLEWISLENVERAETLIISTGGGTPLREPNATLLKQIGTVIWLTATPETIARRVSRNFALRPLLAGHLADPEARIRALLAERCPRYAALAAYHTNSDAAGATPDDVARDLISWLGSDLS